MIKVKRAADIKWYLFLLLWLVAATPISAQDAIPILTLGTFHFDFPNLDKVQYDENEKIDILEFTYQNEIETLVDALAEFSPTIIAIERPAEMQWKIDSLLRLYQAGKYELGRGEYEQIGFRLAKKLGINHIYCVDEWGKHYENINELLNKHDSREYIDFENSFYSHPDSIKEFHPESVFQDHGIIAELISLNKPENIRRSLGNYLIGHFKYESEPHDYIGTDYETGRWFNRNLRIFRNIQRIKTRKEDRIIVIFGAGHMNILNYLLECSPEYRLEDIGQYLTTEDSK